jgi:hypothetical protein
MKSLVSGLRALSPPSSIDARTLKFRVVRSSKKLVISTWYALPDGPSMTLATGTLNRSNNSA